MACLVLACRREGAGIEGWALQWQQCRWGQVGGRLRIMME
jgi:hypothetical protein